MGCGLHSRKTTIIEAKFDKDLHNPLSARKELERIENSINKNTDFGNIKIFDKNENISILNESNNNYNNNDNNDPAINLFKVIDNKLILVNTNLNKNNIILLKTAYLTTIV